MPVRSAITADCPMANVERVSIGRSIQSTFASSITGCGSCQMVCPAEATRSTSSRVRPWSLRSRSTAAAKTSPRRKSSWQMASTRASFGLKSRKTFARSSGGNGKLSKASSLTTAFSPWPVIWTSAASTPSTDVPDMSPTTSRDSLTAMCSRRPTRFTPRAPPANCRDARPEVCAPLPLRLVVGP